MFTRKKRPSIKSLLAAGTDVRGNLHFADGLRIDGSVHGNVHASTERPSLLVISESGQVEGEVVADHIIVNGLVRGPMQARVLLELQPKARVHGDVSYVALEMHPGALITGQLKPVGSQEEKPTLKLAANNQ